ncbi:MAG: DedA family protein [Nitrospirae bacterium]|nr:MAG: DedA family protein [Nitrospirota bacterium]
MDTLHALYEWMLSWAETPYAGWALFALAFAESSFFPIPPDVLLMALTLNKPEWSMWYALISTVGSTLGGMFGYAIGWAGGRPLLLRFIGPQRVAMIHDRFQRYEAWAILIAGFTPIPYKVFTIGAGAFYVNFRVFVLASLISRGGRFFLVAGTLQVMGPWMKEVLERYFNIFTIFLVAVIVLGFVMVRCYAQRARRISSSNVSVGESKQSS